MRSLYTLWPTYTSSVKEKPADWFRRDGEHLRIFQTSPCTRISMNAVSVWCCPQQIEFLEAMRLQDRSYDESALPLPFVNLDHYFSRSWWGKVKKILAIENFQKVIQTQVSQQRPAVFFNQLPLPVFFFLCWKFLDLWNFGTLKIVKISRCHQFSPFFFRKESSFFEEISPQNSDPGIRTPSYFGWRCNWTSMITKWEQHFVGIKPTSLKCHAKFWRDLGPQTSSIFGVINPGVCT